MRIYICRFCGAPLHRCRDTRKVVCEDCRTTVKICNLSPKQTAERNISERESSIVLEAST